jgi:hypothetical protein
LKFGTATKTTSNSISSRQLTRLQTLWSKFYVAKVVPFLAADLGMPKIEHSRMMRLTWAAQRLGLEQLASYKDLDRDQAAKLIELLQAELPKEMVTRRRPSREQAQRYAKEGRRGDTSKLTGPPDATSLALLGTLRAKTELAADQRFEAWLRSRTSPTRGRARLETQADVNRVIWALKGMLRRDEKRNSKTETRNSQPAEVLV